MGDSLVLVGSGTSPAGQTCLKSSLAIASATTASILGDKSGCGGGFAAFWSRG